MARKSAEQLRIERVARYQALRVELGDHDRIVNATEMAAILDMTRPNLRKLMAKEGFPVHHAGTNGQAFMLAVGDVLDWAVQHYGAKAGLIEDRRAAVGQMAAQAPAAQTIDAPDTGQIARFIDAQVKMTRAQQLQGKLVKREDVDRLAQGLVIQVSEFLLGLGAALDPTGRMEPETRSKIESAARDQMSALKNRLSLWLASGDDDVPDAA
jgi:hypothetical protein